MRFDVLLIGSGFGALTAAALLTKRGLKVCILEQANYAGGCSSTFKRKGYWFESGATTLVGLDTHMPLRYLLDQIKVEIPFRKLELPMQVHLPDGQLLTRYNSLEEWIQEAEQVFGRHHQKAFWEHCFKVSQRVWRTSLEQTALPPSNLKDIWRTALRVKPAHVAMLPGAFRTMKEVLQHYGLLHNKLFVDFVNEQLLITAQNYLEEVNELFGCTALCYTLYTNYYVDGGLINLIKPIVNYITGNGSAILYKHRVEEIVPQQNGYVVHTSKGSYKSRYLISGIPLNNTIAIYQDTKVQERLQKYMLPSDKVNGAFTMGLVLKDLPPTTVLHHQVHVPEGLPQIRSKSIFLSYSHPADTLRAPAGQTIAAISTHVSNPAQNYINNKAILEEAILTALEQKGLLNRNQVIYSQSATPGAWIDWTQRAFGLVGGYPQYAHIKPWQMKDARLDHKGAYVCGDTVYPGQGIVGTCLSGIIAVEKLLQDHL